MKESRKISRRTFLEACSAAGVGIVLSGCSPFKTVVSDTTRRKQPNLVFVFADQLRTQSMGYAGGPARTPYLDRFKHNSVDFSNAVSTTPVCSPFRACMLTGKYPHVNSVIANQIRLPDEERTFGEILSEAGYNTGYVGKWHLSGKNRIQYEPPGPGRHGFQYWSAFGFQHQNNNHYYFENSPEPIKPDVYQMDSETDRAIGFINQQTEDKPFGLFLSWGPPHPPYAAWQMPPQYLERYGTVEEVSRSELTEQEQKQWQSWQTPVRFTPHSYDRRKNVEKEYMGGISYAAYHAMTEWVDDCFGRIVQSLEKAGLADNTIVVFTSDHGEMLGSHGLRGKMIYYDESVRIPFIVNWPEKIKPGTVSDACISTVDFLPTVLGLMGIGCPADVQGMNLAHCALGRPGAEPDGAILASYAGYAAFADGWEYRGVRTKRYTYSRSLMQLRRWYGGWGPNADYSREPEIFLSDNQEDLYQQTNLAGAPEYKDIQDQLEARVQAHLDRMGDKFLKGTEYKQFYDEENRRIKPLV